MDAIITKVQTVHIKALFSLKHDIGFLLNITLLTIKHLKKKIKYYTNIKSIIVV